MGGLARRAIDAHLAMLALGNETFEAEGATFVRNRALPQEREANFVARPRAATRREIARLLARVEREFTGLPYRRFEIDHDTPPALEARLLLEGYAHEETVVSVLEGDLPGEAPPCDIRPVEDEAGWAARAALVAASWPGYQERRSPSADLEAAIRSGRSKCPPMRYWLAYVEGEARGYVASLAGVQGIGQVEFLFAHPEYRHRGVATALIHRAVADCRERGAGPIIITAEASDTPKRMYEALGFRPAGCCAAM